MTGEDDRPKEKPVYFAAYEEEGSYDASAPERSLLLAIIAAAVDDLGGGGPAGRRAADYLSPSAPDHLFSFANICRMLDIDPERVRRAASAAPAAGARPLWREKP